MRTWRKVWTRGRFTRVGRRKTITCGWLWQSGRFNKNGVDVGYTRVQDVYQSPLQGTDGK